MVANRDDKQLSYFDVESQGNGFGLPEVAAKGESNKGLKGRLAGLGGDAQKRRRSSRTVGQRKFDLARIIDADLRIDPVLVGSAIALSVISTIACSGSVPFVSSLGLRQAVYSILGIGIMLAVSRIDYARYFEARWHLYAASVAAIIAVVLFASVNKGAKLSLDFGFFNFQASELGKVIIVYAGAAYLVTRAKLVDNWSTTLRVLAICLVPALLTFDFGTSSVYGAIAVGLLLVGGAPGRHLTILATMFVLMTVTVFAVLPKVGLSPLKPYQVARVTAFVKPNHKPSASEIKKLNNINPWYQIKQGKTAIGAGRRTGRGDEARMVRLGYLPEWRTDFIFAAIGERFGFVGVAAVLSLFALIMWRGLRILATARDFFGALIAAGILLMLLFQVLVNAGMNVGIMPITGIPLPLVSYGGSSVLSTYLALGLLLSIYAQSRKRS